jgi:hypothetical protein
MDNTCVLLSMFLAQQPIPCYIEVLKTFITAHYIHLIIYLFT